MRPTLIATLALAAVGGALLLTSEAADAQTRKRGRTTCSAVQNQQRDARHRVRPRVNVAVALMYLDAGPQLHAWRIQVSRIRRALRLFRARQCRPEPDLEPQPVQRAVRYARRASIGRDGSTGGERSLRTEIRKAREAPRFFLCGCAVEDRRSAVPKHSV